MQTYSLARIGNSPKWYVLWTVERRSYRRSTGCTDREEAEAFPAAFKLAAEAPKTIDLTVSDALSFYRDNKNVVAAQTAELIANRLKAFYGSTPLLSAGPASQQIYVTERRGQGVKDETIRRELAVLSAALRYTRKYKELERVPEVISLPASPPKERWINRDEAAMIFRHLRTGWLPPTPLDVAAPPQTRSKHHPGPSRKKTDTFCSSRVSRCSQGPEPRRSLNSLGTAWI